MGCCSSSSGHEEATKTNLEPPMFGKDVNVKLIKQGMFDWDFDVHNNDDSEGGKASKGKLWMLVDCVGEQNGGNISYYIKYRHTSMAKSQILGSGNFEEKNMYAWNHVTHASQTTYPSMGNTPLKTSYIPTSSGFHGKGELKSQHKVGTKKKQETNQWHVRGKWIRAHRAFIHGPPPERFEGDQHSSKVAPEQANIVGRLQISGYGTYWRTRVHETWLEYCEWEVSDPQKPKAGKVKRYGWEKKSHTTDESGTDLIDIVYKLHCYGQDYTIHHVKPKDAPSWTKDTHLLFEASDHNGLPLFKITSNSKREATVQTFSNADPVTALIAALGIAIKMTPHLFYTLCQKTCDELFDLEAEPNTYGGSGRPDAEFEVHGRHDDFGEYSTFKPTVGFAYGVAAQALQMGKPIEMPQHLFTSVAGVPTFDPRPRAFSPVTPEIGVVPALDPLPGVVPPEPKEPLLVTGSWLDSARDSATP